MKSSPNTSKRSAAPHLAKSLARESKEPGKRIVKRIASDESLKCSFCHKSQDAVNKLISSPSDYPRAYICDECVSVCNSILEEDHAQAPAGTQRQLPRPQEIKEFLDQYVIGQENTKKKLAV